MYLVKYVALLAFNRIVVTHPWLVAQQEDVILECIDSADISIRIKALDLVQGMVSGDNLSSIVSRLMRQLKLSSETRGTETGHGESDDEEFEDARQNAVDEALQLPDDYKIDIINRILKMCSQNNYANLIDFEWYIDVLTQLVRSAPLPRPANDDSSSLMGRSSVEDVSEDIGNELRNVCVKVYAIRSACVQAAELMASFFTRETPAGHPVVSGALKPIAWIIGEFPRELASAEDSLGFLLQLTPKATSPETRASCIQAAAKVFSFITSDDLSLWTPERKSKTLLLMARLIHNFEDMTQHPNLEVQERAVEFTELLKLTAEAATGQDASTEDTAQDPPLLLTQAIPSLFTGWELNSVAPGAQRNVPLPEGLDLDEPINPNLNHLLASDTILMPADEVDEFDTYYYQRPPPMSISSEPAIHRLADARDDAVGSYQQPTEDAYLDPDILARRKAERREKNRDDPFYIQETDSLTRSTTPIHNILQSSNGPDLDVDSIPIMELDLDKLHTGADVGAARKKSPKPSQQKKPRQKIVIAADESLGGVSGGSGSGGSTPRNNNHFENSNAEAMTKARNRKILGVDSTNIGSLSLEGGSDGPDGGPGYGYDAEARQREEAEMARAMREVERLRLEMQRANERIQVAQGVDAAGVVVKKKKKTKKAVPKAKSNASPSAEDGNGDGAAAASPDAAAAGSADVGDAVAVVRKKKKSKKAPATDAETAAEAEAGTEADLGADVAKPKKKTKTKKKARPAEILE